jgi:hypothetical protein
MRPAIRSILAAMALMSISNTSFSAPQKISPKAGVCYRLSKSCRHDVVLIAPSGDETLDEAALDIFGGARIPEPCQSPGGDHRWLGKFLYSGDAAQTDQGAPSCAAMPKWPRRDLGAPMKARWNVPAAK